MDGAILTQAGLWEWMRNNPSAYPKRGDSFTLSGSGSKRVFYNKGSASAEFNRMPQWLQKHVSIHEFTSTSIVKP